MNQSIKISILQGLKILNTSKDFILYNLDANNKVTDYKLTNDLFRYKKQYKAFKVVSCIKRNINTIEM